MELVIRQVEQQVGFEPTRAMLTAYKTVPIDHYGTAACRIGYAIILFLLNAFFIINASNSNLYFQEYFFLSFLPLPLFNDL